MQEVAFDTETFRFGPGRKAPPLVCVSLATGKTDRILLHWKDSPEIVEELLTPEKTTDGSSGAVSSGGYILIGHNVAYDFAVLAAEFPRLLPLIFKAYEDGRIRDTMLRQQLLDIAVGWFRGRWLKRPGKDGKQEAFWQVHGYGLDDITWRHLKIKLEKTEWRLRYSEFRDIPIPLWPEGARKYAKDDAGATLGVHDVQKLVAEKAESTIAQRGLVERPSIFADEARQCRAAWWIQLMLIWGIRTAPDRVHRLQEEVEVALQTLSENLQEVGLVRANGKRNTKAARARMILVMKGEHKCRRTKKSKKFPNGQISLDEDACLSSGDVILQDYAELSSLGTVKTKDVKALMRGVVLPIHSKFRSLIATGRTSSSDPNIQNIRRLPGIRECFVPRKGLIFLDADYDGLELRTLAQVCIKLLGKSVLGETLNKGRDAHLVVAMQILNKTYEATEILFLGGDDKADDARQAGKVANFGFPGGLGFETFVYLARKTYGIKTMDEHKARVLKTNWLNAYPEMEDYFAYIDRLVRRNPQTETAMVEHLFSKRIRGGVPYTVACNSLFQGLGADATKAAGFLVAKACYVDRSSPLFGYRIVNYVHDQFILEGPEDRAHEAAWELKILMERGAAPFLPDVPPIVSKPLVARYWSKKAKQVWRRPDGSLPLPGEKLGWDNGRLFPWEGEYEVKMRDRRAS